MRRYNLKYILDYESCHNEPSCTAFNPDYSEVDFIRE